MRGAGGEAGRPCRSGARATQIARVSLIEGADRNIIQQNEGKEREGCTQHKSKSPPHRLALAPRCACTRLEAVRHAARHAAQRGQLCRVRSCPDAIRTYCASNSTAGAGSAVCAWGRCGGAKNAAEGEQQDKGEQNCFARIGAGKAKEESRSTNPNPKGGEKVKLVKQEARTMGNT